MIQTLQIGNNLSALSDACDACDLQIIQASSFRRTIQEDVPEGECLMVLRVKPFRHCLSSREINEVGVYRHDGGLLLAWDEFRDGFGLVSLIGSGGWRLLQRYRIAAIRRVCAALGLEEETLQLDYQGPFTLERAKMQKRVTVTVSPDGEHVDIKTEGFTGNECQKATRELEAALGQVTSDKPTAEAHTHAVSQNLHA